MHDTVIIWDLEDDRDGNYVHIVIEHGITQDEVDDVLGNARNETVPSDATGRPSTFRLDAHWAPYHRGVGAH